MAVIKDNQPIYKMYYGETPVYNIITRVSKENIFTEKLGWSNEDEESLAVICEYSEQKAKEFNPNNSSQSQFFREEEQHPLVIAPMLDFSKVTNCYELFSMCVSLVAVPKYDFSKVTNARGMFNRCENLTTIPEFNFESLEDAGEMFFYARNLKKLPYMNFSKVTNINGFFGYWDDIKTLTDVGGFGGLSIDWTDDEGLVRCPNLTLESANNIIEHLADMSGKEEKMIKLHKNVALILPLDILEKAVNKNWTILVGGE